MRTKELIKKTAIKLFNEEGFNQITLRDIAAELKKSYGNITYHYPNKEILITEIYNDMSIELKQLSAHFSQEKNLLIQILQAPSHSFEISLKYRFLFTDYVELMRKYQKLAFTVKEQNEMRKRILKKRMMILVRGGIFHSQIGEQEIEYLMELSGAMRTFFFLNINKPSSLKSSTKMKYVEYVNQLIYPYLSAKGRKIYLSNT